VLPSPERIIYIFIADIRRKVNRKAVFFGHYSVCQSDSLLMPAMSRGTVNAKTKTFRKYVRLTWIGKDEQGRAPPAVPSEITAFFGGSASGMMVRAVQSLLSQARPIRIFLYPAFPTADLTALPRGEPLGRQKLRLCQTTYPALGHSLGR